MTSVIIVHHLADRAFAAQLGIMLQQNGLEAAWNFDAFLNKDRVRAVCADIDQKEVALVLWSWEAVSDESMLDQAQHAQASGKLLNVRLSETAIPEPLNASETFDLSAWTGHSDHADFRPLVARLKPRTLQVATTILAAAPVESDSEAPVLAAASSKEFRSEAPAGGAWDWARLGEHAAAGSQEARQVSAPTNPGKIEWDGPAPRNVGGAKGSSRSSPHNPAGDRYGAPGRRAPRPKPWAPDRTWQMVVVGVILALALGVSVFAVLTRPTVPYYPSKTIAALPPVALPTLGSRAAEAADTTPAEQATAPSPSIGPQPDEPPARAQGLPSGAQAEQPEPPREIAPPEGERASARAQSPAAPQEIAAASPSEERPAADDLLSVRPELRAAAARARNAAQRAAAAARSARANAHSDEESARLNVASLPANSVYEGDWGSRGADGLGVVRTAAGARYAGAWRRARPEGAGVLTYADGLRYEGEFEAGAPNGRGVYLNAEGRVLSGSDLFVAMLKARGESLAAPDAD